jgi:uncharacterized lipoprotein YddW (UPF0748 family)
MNLVLLLACSDSGSTVRSAAPDDTDVSDTDDTDDTHTDDTDAPSDVELVDVAHARELRGLFVATVYNIDWPSGAGLSVAEQDAQLVTLLDLAEDARMNAVFVQMRPEGDALYASSIEPWSEWLTGTQGVDPDYDPLERWIVEAHARGIEVHAWLNPYRAKVGSESISGFAEGHMALAFPEHTIAYGGDVWMDPGAESVRGRVVDVTEDLLTRYDLDGIHFDDYFYPYPDDGDFPDDATWNAYVAGGGTLARDDWRRENTSLLVRDVSVAIAAIDPAVRFGISPFGIWRPGYPSGIVGFDAYEGLYADPLNWVSNGWLDYLSPQLYWETGNEGQEYEALTEWWNAQLPDDTWLFPANALYQLGSSDTWTLDEFAAQIDISRRFDLARTRGNMWYNASPFIDDAAGVRDAFATRYYPTQALPPVVNALGGVTEPPPTVTVDGATAAWEPADGRRAITVYTSAGEAWNLASIVPAGGGSVTLASGRWALASVGKGGVESRAVVVTVP